MGTRTYYIFSTYVLHAYIVKYLSNAVLNIFKEGI